MIIKNKGGRAEIIRYFATVHNLLMSVGRREATFKGLNK